MISPEKHIITIYNAQIPFELHRSDKRRTCSISIAPGGLMTVRIPSHMSKNRLLSILQDKDDWIYKTYMKYKDVKVLENSSHLTEEERAFLEKKYRMAARKYIKERVDYYLPFTGGSVSSVCIRNQKTRWGSCSSNHTLSFNWRLMLAPPAILDYVVVHELCHLTHMNHSKDFWAAVERILPDYKERRKWLKEHGNELFL